MSETRKISATLGQPIQIVLQSMMYSTGYGWYLKDIKGGVALSTAQVVPTSTGISPVNHLFDFLAVAEGTFTIEFALIAPWQPLDVADTEVFEITISESVKANVEAAKGRDFVSAPTVNLGATASPPTVLKYAAPMAQAGAIPQVIYAAPMAQAAAWPQVIYAAPMAQAAAWPQVIYAAPMAQAAALAGPMSMATTMIAYAAPGMPANVATALRANAAMTQNMPQPGWPQVIYAAPMTQTASWAQMLYAAPMAQAAAYPQILYAAPMTQGGWPFPVYAAPGSFASGGAVQPLYAVPMPQCFTNAAVMQPYAAPFTGGGTCC